MSTPPAFTEIDPPSPLGRVAAVLRAAGRILVHKDRYYDFNDLATIQDGVDGPAFQRAAQRMRTDPEGTRLLEDRIELNLRTIDWDRLSRLPVDTLGYNLWHHFFANDLFHEVVLAPPIIRWDPDTEYAKHRYRMTHDFRHVMLGLGTDPYEEVIVQTFQYAQLPQKLSLLIVLFGSVKHALMDGKWRELRQGLPLAWRSGRKARFLSNTPFEDLLELPLAEVRERWGVEPVGTAYPVTERHPGAPWAPTWPDAQSGLTRRISAATPAS